MSSVEGFFDVIYLAVFVVLSPAFDDRFYEKAPSKLVDESDSAKECAESILVIFARNFFILLDGEPVAFSYVFNRMLGEFAAASVVFAKAIREVKGEDHDDDDDEVTYEMFRGRVDNIFQCYHSEVFPYYSSCVDRGHKHFLWTGPKVDVLPRSKACDCIILAELGERKDLPSHKIYASPQDPGSAPGSPTSNVLPSKRRDRGDSTEDVVGPSKKRR